MGNYMHFLTHQTTSQPMPKVARRERKLPHMTSKITKARKAQNCLLPLPTNKHSSSFGANKSTYTSSATHVFALPHCLKLLVKDMNNSIQQDLIESSELSDDYSYLKDDDAPDESHYLYLINAILSGTARLNVLLPTATILAFTIFAPLLTNDGVCTTLNRWMMGVFWAFLAASCVFFTFTDSFRTSTGRLYYGVATFRGIWTFNGGRKKPSVPLDYRLRWADLFHASLSLVAFLTFSGSHSDVVRCYYPRMPRKVINTVPLVIGFLISVLFVLFPTKRRGIGYPFLLQSDALRSRC